MTVAPLDDGRQGSLVPALLLRRAIDALLPPRCPCCNAIVSGEAGLCGACWTAVDFIAPPICSRLGTPFPYDPGGPAESPAAIAHPPDYDRARAVARYTGPARVLVHALKFRDRLEAADLMASWMLRAGAELIAGTDVVVPVPLHRRRLFSRRFNQSAMLAERIVRSAGLSYLPVGLVRSKPTRQQVGLSMRERRRNVSGAFRVPPEEVAKLKDRRVLLVDDVLTTGATVNACARACRRAGAASVDVLVFARVVGDGATTI